MAVLYLLLGNLKTGPKWVLEVDIKGFFDNVNHEWIVKNIVMNKSVMKQFLKSG